MKRAVAILLLLLVAIAAGAAVHVARTGPAPKGPAFSVRAARAMLTASGAGAGGDVLLVRGVLIGGSGTLGDGHAASAFGLGEPTMSVSNPILWVAPESDPLRSFLRKIALVQAVIPAPQGFTSGLRTYHIRLNRQHACSSGLCPDAFLLDAAP